MTRKSYRRDLEQILDRDNFDTKCEMQAGLYLTLIIIVCFILALSTGSIEVKSHICSEDLIGTCRFGAMDCANNTKLCDEYGCGSCIKAMDPFDQPSYKCMSTYQCSEIDLRVLFLVVLYFWVLFILVSLGTISAVLEDLRKRKIWV